MDYAMCSARLLSGDLLKAALALFGANRTIEHSPRVKRLCAWRTVALGPYGTRVPINVNRLF